MRIKEIQSGEITVTLFAPDAFFLGRALEAAAVDAMGPEVPRAFWGGEVSADEGTIRALESMAALFQTMALSGELQGYVRMDDADNGLAWLRARKGVKSMTEAVAAHWQEVERRRAAMSPPAPGQGGEAPTTPGDEQGGQQEPDGGGG